MSPDPKDAAPLAVLDLDMTRLPERLRGLERYAGALALLRLEGRPVGQALFPLPGAEIAREALRVEVHRTADTAFWEAWLRHRIGAEAPRAEPPARPATVAVCTRERPADLRRCLRALAALPEDGQELLVVDNRPATDATRRVAESFPGVRYIREDRPGLDAARNRALREARHDVVAFTDDDAAPDPGWLRALLRHFEDPGVLCATGLTMPMELETPAQQWYQRLGGFSRGFRRRVLDGGKLDPFEGWKAGAGVNMAFRREVLDLVGPFDEALDVGTPTAGGGDTDMYRRILAGGHRIVYDPEALVWHQHRREWRLLRKQLYGYDSAGLAIFTRALLFEGDLSVPLRVTRWLWQELRHFAASVLGLAGHPPADLVGARLLGAAAGPWAYLLGRWRARRSGPVAPVGSEREDPGAVGRDPSEAGSATPRRADGAPAAPRSGPEVSVVIPTHDRLSSVRRTLAALARQTFPAGRMEVVVAADGCTDGTAEDLRASTWPFRLSVRETPGLGSGAARNAGVEEARAPLLLFLDDDVEPSEGLVAAHVGAHGSPPAEERVLVGPYLPPPGSSAGWLRARIRAWWGAHFDRLAEPGHRWDLFDVVSGNLSLPAALFRRVGGFDPELIGAGEDYELGHRLVRAGARPGYLPEARAAHHELPGDAAAGAFRRAGNEGRADVLVARKHPELTPRLWFASFADGGPPSVRALRRLAFRLPRAADGLLRRLPAILVGLERLGLRRSWETVFGAGRALAYLRGAKRAAGRLDALQELAGEADVPSARAPQGASSRTGPAEEAIVEAGRALPDVGVPGGAAARARRRGRADVRAARAYPQLRARLPLARFQRPFGLRGRLVYTMTFRWPRLGEACAKILGRLAPAWEGLPHGDLSSHPVTRGLWTFWYFRGVADELGTPSALGELVASAVPGRLDGVDDAIDLREGLGGAERLLDRLRPGSVTLVHGGRLIGRIPPLAGAEPLRGAHLRHHLAREHAPALLEAWILEGEGPADDGPLHAAHLRRGPWWDARDALWMWQEQYAQWEALERRLAGAGPLRAAAEERGWAALEALLAAPGSPADGEGILASPPPWRSVGVEDLGLPTSMLAPDELALLRWLASRHYLGAGEIVDAGCFVGGSTVALAAGLAENERVASKAERIHSYDRFRMQRYMLEDYLGGEGPEKGEDFFSLFERNVAPWSRSVRVHRGDLLEASWHGDPIEILFVDIAKTPELNDHVVREFFPRLIPGRSVVVQQDYVHEWLPWIHVTMERLWDYFELLDLFGGGSAVFLLTRPLPPLSAFTWRGPDEEVLGHMDRALDRLPARYRPVVAMARVRLLADLGRAEEAAATLREARARAGDDSRLQRAAREMADHIDAEAVPPRS